MFQGSSDPTYIMNPCYVEGYNTTHNASTIYDSECTKKPKNYNPDQEIFMVGAPDSEKCRSIVKSIFDFETCSSSHCSYDGVEQPPVTGDFMVTQSTNVNKWNESRTAYTVFLLFTGICWILLHCKGSADEWHIGSWSIQLVSDKILPLTLDSGEFLTLVNNRSN